MKVTRFQMRSISVDQFAILKDAMPEKIRIKTEPQIGTDVSHHVVAIRMRVSYLNSDEEPILVLQVTCTFAIHPDDWNGFVKEEKIVIPHALLSHFAMHTYGTMRGILFCKTETSSLGGVILPPENVDDLMPNEYTIKK